jgi:8-oxo-dGTP pyrophosphatase MutT (NUDIX family)
LRFAHDSRWMSEPDAAVAILRTSEPEDSILLIRRAERVGDAWSGHWSFPGGRCEPGDRDPLHTALRELEEECGIRIGPEDLHTALPPRLARRRVGRFLMVAPFVFHVPRPLPAVLDISEAVDALWLPLRTFRDPGAHRLQCVPGVSGDLRYPCMQLDGAPLWGFTYRLIADWLELVTDEQTGCRIANLVLEFLLAGGLTLRRGWSGNEALVEGPIPTGRVLDRFCSPGDRIPALNLLEVREDCIRIVGLDFEEYVIRSSSGGD